MDEITLFATLRPEPAAGQDRMRQAARDRLTASLQGPDQRRLRGRRGSWRMPVAAGALAAAAAASLVLSAGGSPAYHEPAGRTSSAAGPASIVTAAWTVKRVPSGLITITIRQEVSDPAGLQRALRSEGIRALVRVIPVKYQIFKGQRVTYQVCNYAGQDLEPPAVQRAVIIAGPGPGVTFRPFGWIINPLAMPRGSALLLPLSVSHPSPDTGVGQINMVEVLAHDAVPPCVPVSGPTPLN